MADPTEHERALISKIVDSGVAVVQAVGTRGAISQKSFTATGRQCRSPHVFNEVIAMRQAMQKDGDERPLTVEVRHTDTGYQLQHTFDLLSISPAEVVLDPDYRYPGHPRPGMPRPEGSQVTDRPTDPVVLAEIRDLVGEYVSFYTSIKGRAPEFAAGLTEAEILTAETAMGVRLPEEVRALYRMTNGDPAEHGLLGAQNLLPLDTVVGWYLEGGPGTTSGDDQLFPVNPVAFDSYPTGHVRRVSRSDWWVTIASDFACNYCAIDLDPLPEGRRGQLFEYGRDFHGPVGYVAESLTVVLRQVVAALRSGAYESENDDSPYLGVDEQIGRSVETDYVRSQRVLHRTTRSIVNELVNPLDVQQLYLNQGESIDLSELAPLANLRALSINQASRANNALPHRLPVESLQLEAHEADLADLAGHPSLWHLELKKFNHSVNVDALAAIPHLTALDVSDVDVTDVERLADLPELRVLTMSGRQWGRLRDADRLPPRLAAARMAGQTLLDEAVNWVRWLRERTNL